MPTLSVVISSYNGLQKLKLSLAAYCNQTFSDFEIIIAADGSSDGTLEYVRDNKHLYPYPLKAVWHEDRGFRLARIRNCGWKIANSPRVIFTDQDIVPNADCLSHYSVHAAEDSVIAGSIYWIDEAIHRIFTVDTIKTIKQFDPFITQNELRDLQRYNFWVVWGGNMSVPFNLFNKIGGFDEEFAGWGGEDTDLALRCENMGMTIKTCPEAKMFHLNHPPSNSLNRTGSDLFYEKKQSDTSIARNPNAKYDDVIVV